MASVPCNNSELEGLETAEGEQRNGADPDHEHRERAQIAVEPKRSLYAHERSPILPIEPRPGLRLWASMLVAAAGALVQMRGWGSSPLCHSGASRLRPGVFSVAAVGW